MCASGVLMLCALALVVRTICTFVRQWLCACPTHGADQMYRVTIGKPSFSHVHITDQKEPTPEIWAL